MLGIFIHDQKCANYGKQYQDGFVCNYTEHRTIFSPNRLSKEGMCINCEFRCMPDRFHGCMFCKRPLRKIIVCSVCADGFSKWLQKNLNVNIGMIHRFIRTLTNPNHKKQQHISENNQYSIIRTQSLIYGWPGFFIGPDENGQPQWIIPRLLNDSDPNISLVLAKYHIDLMEYIQFDKQYLDQIDVEKINNNSSSTMTTIIR